MTTTTDLDRWLDLRAWMEPAGAEPGTAARLVVEATIPDGGHIEAHEPPDPFLIPTVLEITPGTGVEAGAVAYPRPEERRLEWAPDTVLWVLAGTVRFEARSSYVRPPPHERGASRLD